MLKGQAKGPEPPQQFERLVRPHVASFDYFLQDGMRQAVQLQEPLQVRSATADILHCAGSAHCAWLAAAAQAHVVVSCCTLSLL